MDDYRSFFRVARHNASDKARTYLAGPVMKAPRKNMERMEEYVQGCDYQAQQYNMSGKSFPSTTSPPVVRLITW